MSEIVENMDEPVEEFGEEDLPQMIYWLFEIYNNIESMDTALMGKDRKRQTEAWKNKIWHCIDNYINALPTE